MGQSPKPQERFFSLPYIGQSATACLRQANFWSSFSVGVGLRSPPPTDINLNITNYELRVKFKDVDKNLPSKLTRDKIITWRESVQLSLF